MPTAVAARRRRISSNPVSRNRLSRGRPARHLLETNNFVSAVALQFGPHRLGRRHHRRIPASTSQPFSPAAGRNKRASSISLNWLRRSQ